MTCCGSIDSLHYMVHNTFTGSILYDRLEEALNVIFSNFTTNLDTKFRLPVILVDPVPCRKSGTRIRDKTFRIHHTDYYKV